MYLVIHPDVQCCGGGGRGCSIKAGGVPCSTCGAQCCVWWCGGGGGGQFTINTPGAQCCGGGSGAHLPSIHRSGPVRRQGQCSTKAGRSRCTTTGVQCHVLCVSGVLVQGVHGDVLCFLLHGQDMDKTQDCRSGIEQWLAVGGWRRLAVGGWRLAVGGPWGLSLRAVLHKKIKIGVLRTAL